LAVKVVNWDQSKSCFFNSNSFFVFFQLIAENHPYVLGIRDTQSVKVRKITMRNKHSDISMATQKYLFP
jgi:hypothetical protein